MHEVGIMEQALEMALEAASGEGSVRITKLSMRIGTLAGVVPDALSFAFDIVTQGTVAEGAEFEWEEVPVLCRCGNGCPDFHPEGVVYACPECGVPSYQVLEGRELNVVGIEVETSVA